MSAAELILFIGVSVAFIAGVFALAAMFGARARKFNKRAANLSARLKIPASDATGPGDLRRTEPKRFPVIEALVNRALPKPEVLRARLDRTGKRISGGGYAGAGLLVAAMVAIAAAVAGGLDLPAAAFAGLRRAHLYRQAPVRGGPGRLPWRRPGCAVPVVVLGAPWATMSPALRRR